MGIAMGNENHMQRFVLDLHFQFGFDYLFTDDPFGAATNQGMSALLFIFDISPPAKLLPLLCRTELRSFVQTQNGFTFYFKDEKRSDDFVLTLPTWSKTARELCDHVDYFDETTGDLNPLLQLVQMIPDHRLSQRGKNALLSAVNWGYPLKKIEVARTRKGYTIAVPQQDELNALIAEWRGEDQGVRSANAARGYARLFTKCCDAFYRTYEKLIPHMLQECEGTQNRGITPLTKFLELFQRESRTPPEIRPVLCVSGVDVHVLLTGTRDLAKDYETLQDIPIESALADRLDMHVIDSIRPHIFPGGVRYRYNIRCDLGSNIDYVSAPETVDRLVVSPLHQRIRKMLEGRALGPRIVKLSARETFIRQIVLKIACDRNSLQRTLDAASAAFILSSNEVQHIGAGLVITATCMTDYRIQSFERAFLRDIAKFYRRFDESRKPGSVFSETQFPFHEENQILG
jgi:hypothetical protein